MLSSKNSQQQLKNFLNQDLGSQILQSLGPQEKLDNSNNHNKSIKQIDVIREDRIRAVQPSQQTSQPINCPISNQHINQQKIAIQKNERQSDEGDEQQQSAKIQQIRNPTNIMALSLCGNGKKSPLRSISGLEVFSNLIDLDLSHNQICKIENLDKLTKIKRLNMSYNKILKIENIHQLQRMIELDLSHNQIDCIPENIKFTAALQVFKLSFNNIADRQSIINAKKFLPELSVLDLSNNPVSNYPDFNIMLVSNIESLSQLGQPAQGLDRLATDIIKSYNDDNQAKQFQTNQQEHVKTQQSSHSELKLTSSLNQYVEPCEINMIQQQQQYQQINEKNIIEMMNSNINADGYLDDDEQLLVHDIQMNPKLQETAQQRQQSSFSNQNCLQMSTHKKVFQDQKNHKKQKCIKKEQENCQHSSSDSKHNQKLNKDPSQIFQQDRVNRSLCEEPTVNMFQLNQEEISDIKQEIQSLNGFSLERNSEMPLHINLPQQQLLQNIQYDEAFKKLQNPIGVAPFSSSVEKHSKAESDCFNSSTSPEFTSKLNDEELSKKVKLAKEEEIELLQNIAQTEEKCKDLTEKFGQFSSQLIQNEKNQNNIRVLLQEELNKTQQILTQGMSTIINEYTQRLDINNKYKDEYLILEFRPELPKTLVSIIQSQLDKIEYLILNILNSKSKIMQQSFSQSSKDQQLNRLQKQYDKLFYQFQEINIVYLKKKNIYQQLLKSAESLIRYFVHFGCLVQAKLHINQVGQSINHNLTKRSLQIDSNNSPKESLRQYLFDNCSNNSSIINLNVNNNINKGKNKSNSMKGSGCGGIEFNYNIEIDKQVVGSKIATINENNQTNKDSKAGQKGESSEEVETQKERKSNQYEIEQNNNTINGCKESQCKNGGKQHSETGRSWSSAATTNLIEKLSVIDCGYSTLKNGFNYNPTAIIFKEQLDHSDNSQSNLLSSIQSIATQPKQIQLNQQSNVLVDNDLKQVQQQCYEQLSKKDEEISQLKIQMSQLELENAKLKQQQQSEVKQMFMNFQEQLKQQEADKRECNEIFQKAVQHYEYLQNGNSEVQKLLQVIVDGLQLMKHNGCNAESLIFQLLVNQSNTLSNVVQQHNETKEYYQQTLQIFNKKYNDLIANTSTKEVQTDNITADNVKVQVEQSTPNNNNNIELTFQTSTSKKIQTEFKIPSPNCESVVQFNSCSNQEDQQQLQYLANQIDGFVRKTPERISNKNNSCGLPQYCPQTRFSNTNNTPITNKQSLQLNQMHQQHQQQSIQNNNVAAIKQDKQFNEQEYENQQTPTQRGGGLSYLAAVTQAEELSAQLQKSLSFTCSSSVKKHISIINIQQQDNKSNNYNEQSNQTNCNNNVDNQQAQAINQQQNQEIMKQQQWISISPKTLLSQIPQKKNSLDLSSPELTARENQSLSNTMIQNSEDSKKNCSTSKHQNNEYQRSKDQIHQQISPRYDQFSCNNDEDQLLPPREEEDDIDFQQNDQKNKFAQNLTEKTFSNICPIPPVNANVGTMNQKELPCFSNLQEKIVNELTKKNYASQGNLGYNSTKNSNNNNSAQALTQTYQNIINYKKQQLKKKSKNKNFYLLEEKEQQQQNNSSQQSLINTNKLSFPQNSSFVRKQSPNNNRNYLQQQQQQQPSINNYNTYNPVSSQNQTRLNVLMENQQCHSARNQNKSQNTFASVIPSILTNNINVINKPQPTQNSQNQQIPYKYFRYNSYNNNYKKQQTTQQECPQDEQQGQVFCYGNKMSQLSTGMLQNYFSEKSRSVVSPKVVGHQHSNNENFDANSPYRSHYCKSNVRSNQNQNNNTNNVSAVRQGNFNQTQQSNNYLHHVEKCYDASRKQNPSSSKPSCSQNKKNSQTTRRKILTPHGCDPNSFTNNISANDQNNFSQSNPSQWTKCNYSSIEKTNHCSQN